MKNSSKKLDGIILMGAFGSGKSYLGRSLNARNLGRYTDLEPIIYDLFSNEVDNDVEQATIYIRNHYYETLLEDSPLVAVFESTGVVQRPLLEEVRAEFKLALIRVVTPKDICLARVEERNKTAKHPLDMAKAEEFYDFWTTEIAPTYQFALSVNGMDEQEALNTINNLVN